LVSQEECEKTIRDMKNGRVLKENATCLQKMQLSRRAQLGSARLGSARLGSAMLGATFLCNVAQNVTEDLLE
jgi:hypothetical protein